MQLDPILGSTIVALVALGITVFTVFRDPKRLTVEGIVKALHESTTSATELVDVATIGVQAAEQLYRSGKIERSARLNVALTYVKRWFPDLNDDVLIKTIEAAVLVVNGVVATLPVVPLRK